MSTLSVAFLTFLLILAVAYHIAPPKVKPYIILLGNVYFFIQFDIRYSIFLLFSILTVFFGTILMEKAEKAIAKKAILSLTLVLNIGLLFFVKYVPWLLGLASSVLPFDAVGFAAKIIVPVGISFYTLQICGYMVDVYRNKYSAEKNFFKFASFSTFFPLMLQGPISRYDQLADQLWYQAKRSEIYHNFTYGAQLMLWGFFKKLVIADRAAIAVNAVFAEESQFKGIAVIIGILCYTVQIYTDFSGCVDISRGAAQLFGINVMENFKHPYFATSIQDFWKRWHIALSSWLRDYVYISLGGNRKGAVRKYINMIIVFFVSGLWHGVGIHYIIWGLLQAFYQIVGALTLKPKKKLCELLHINRESVIFKNYQRLVTFILVNVSWVIFRATGTTAAINILKNAIVFNSGYEVLPEISFFDAVVLVAAIAVLFFVSYYQNKGCHIRDEISKTATPVRWTIFLLAFVVILILGIYGPGYSSASFIYMNF